MIKCPICNRESVLVRLYFGEITEFHFCEECTKKYNEVLSWARSYDKEEWAANRAREFEKQHSSVLLQVLEDLAEGDCYYGDGCPTFGSRHGTCTVCKARKAIEKHKEVSQ
jgi:hypothetical protein